MIRVQTGAVNVERAFERELFLYGFIITLALWACERCSHAHVHCLADSACEIQRVWFKIQNFTSVLPFFIYFYFYFFGDAFFSCILLMYEGEFLKLPHSPVHLLFVCLNWIVANHAVFIIPHQLSFVSVWGTMIILILFTVLLHINFANMIEICIPACWF